MSTLNKNRPIEKILVFTITYVYASFVYAQLYQDAYPYKNGFHADEYLIELNASEALYRNARLVISSSYAFQDPSADDLYQEAHEHFIASNLKGEWEQICSVSVNSSYQFDQILNAGIGYRFSYYDFFAPSLGFYHRAVQPAILLPWSLSIEKNSLSYMSKAQLFLTLEFDPSNITHHLTFKHMLYSKDDQDINYELGVISEYAVNIPHSSKHASDSEELSKVSLAWLVRMK